MKTEQPIQNVNIYITVHMADNRFALPSQENFKVTLPEKMGNKFSNGELRGVATKLDIDYEEIKRSTKSETIQELIGYCERREILSGLLTICAAERPHIAWPTIR